MNYQEAVEIIAASQGPGRYICPKCTGGTDQEHSLSIRIDDAGGIHWMCFRSTCGYRGNPRGVTWAFSERRPKEPRHYTRPYRPLTEDQLFLIDSRYGLRGAVDGYNELDDRFILCVRGPNWQMRGHIAYSLSGATPKSLTYNAKPDQPFTHWATVHKPNTQAIVIVEDWFSAEKVREAGAIGIALMGTHIDQAMVTEISVAATKLNVPTFVALDRDAYTKTLLYLSRYREQFPRGLYAWSLVKDLKYVPVDRIKRALDGSYDFSRDDERPEYA